MKNIHSQKLKTIVWITTILYFLFLIWVLYLKFGQYSTIAMQHANLHQFTGYERLMIDINPFKLSPMHSDKRQAVIEIILNAFVTFPLGVALNIIDKKPKLWKHLIIVFSFSLIIECLQFVTLIGGFTPSDLIMNTLGCVIGYIIYHVIVKRLPDRVNVTIFTIANAILSASLVYAVITIIDIKELLKEIFSVNHLTTIPWK